MKLEHIDDVMVIEKSCFSIPWMREAFVEEITKNSYARYIVAMIGKAIVGYAGMWIIIDEAHITNIAVLPAYQGCGIGSRLLEGLISMAGSEDVNKMTLEVRKSNLTAQALYSKYEFVEEGRRREYYADNREDAVIMWRDGITSVAKTDAGQASDAGQVWKGITQ